MLDNMFDRYDRIRPLWDDGPGGDARSKTRLEPPLEWPAGSRLTDDPERPGQIAGTHGEAIHRGARERRQIDLCANIL